MSTHQHPETDHAQALKRSLSLPLLALYGLGNILGAGVYVLIGKVAGAAGYAAPEAFLLAAAIATITALSYAEMASRFPQTASESVYLQEGLHHRYLALAAGLLIIATGTVSAAAMARGFSGYLQVFVALPDEFVTGALITALAALALWGIQQSVITAALLTLVEVIGLLIVIWVAFPEWGDYLQHRQSNISSWQLGSIFSGAFLAFYAFVGFEDMVNVVEEVKKPRRTMPMAILLALGLASGIYILVAVSALAVLTPDQLQDSAAPLATVYTTVTGSSPRLIAFISLFAVVNGALIQIIMASRVCFGLARKGWIPGWLAWLHPRTQTPVPATLLVSGLILLAALSLPITTLARFTTGMLLVIFGLVNLALVRIKLRGEGPAPAFHVPLLIPILGVLLCFMFLGTELVGLSYSWATR